jgi:hyperosmotically inducible protein
MNRFDNPFRHALIAAALVVAALSLPIFDSAAQVVQPTPSPAATPDDVQIEARVRAALVADSALAGNSIKVESNHGLVELAGTVVDAKHVDRAVDVARRVPGVKMVSTKLRFIAPDTTIASLSRPA